MTIRKRLEEYTVIELKEKAKSKKISGYSTMKKAELINAIRAKYAKKGGTPGNEREEWASILKSAYGPAEQQKNRNTLPDLSEYIEDPIIACKKRTERLQDAFNKFDSLESSDNFKELQDYLKKLIPDSATKISSMDHTGLYNFMCANKLNGDGSLIGLECNFDVSTTSCQPSQLGGKGKKKTQVKSKKVKKG